MEIISLEFMDTKSENKMKKKILILIFGIILIGIVGFIGTVSLGIVEMDFTEKVLIISTEKICEVELLSNVFESKCTEYTPKKINVDESIISITKNPKTGVIRVQSK